jgi:hypothetical protein
VFPRQRRSDDDAIPAQERNEPFQAQLTTSRMRWVRLGIAGSATTLVALSLRLDTTIGKDEPS